MTRSHDQYEPVGPVLDFPTAWRIQDEGVKHAEGCSAVPGSHPLSGPGLLCDCGAVIAEYERRRAEQEATNA